MFGSLVWALVVTRPIFGPETLDRVHVCCAVEPPHECILQSGIRLFRSNVDIFKARDPSSFEKVLPTERVDVSVSAMNNIISLPILRAVFLPSRFRMFTPTTFLQFPECVLSLRYPHSLNVF